MESNRPSATGLSVVVAVLLTTAPAVHGARELTLDERVDARWAIEQVFWNHRIWPAENPGPKPSLEQLVSKLALRARVERELEAAAATERSIGRAITSEELQDEVARMIRDSRDPEMLRELFRALKDDPELIAECLARPLVVDRLRQGAAAAGSTLPTAETKRRPWSFCDYDTWHPMTPSPLAPRSHHTAIWTGSEMIVWGGAEPGATQTGAIYTPSMGWWFFTSITPFTPEPRLEHTAVWTGREMIVWGGRDPAMGEGQWLQTGSRFDPYSGAWTTVSIPAEAPSARARHTAVWTGSEMVIWGGEDRSGSLASGGRYDPATDRWREVGQAGSFVPGPRSGHTATWTGDEMIIWGGEDKDASGGRRALGDGARWSPLADAWTPVAADGAPTPRRGHSAIWTGLEAIVWGGLDDSGNPPADTGARYDPATDRWRAVSTVDAPSPRELHSAVWTDQEMVVWGGLDPTGSPPADAGGRYDPERDRWGATTADRAPRGRAHHTAVWKIWEMIVWGGSEGTAGSLLGDGGRYCAQCAFWFPDADGDGFGLYGTGVVACEQPAGYVDNFDDCDDADASIHPGVEEICNLKDDNCREGADEGVMTRFYRDWDGDGFGRADDGWSACTAPEGYVADATDCDDSRAAVHPGAEERFLLDNCDDGRDNDCDGLIDGQEPDCASSITKPDFPWAPPLIYAKRSAELRTGGARCDLGDPVEYQFRWDDGALSEWTTTGRASHTWVEPGEYAVPARARCGGHPEILSPWTTPVRIRVIAQPTSGPDLVASPRFVRQDCKQWSAFEVCTLKARIVVRNAGDDPAWSSRLEWRVSDERAWEEGDTPLSSVLVPKLRPGRSKTVKIVFTLPTGTSGRGKYFVGRLDPANSIRERDELNNQFAVTIGP
ncbi:MAG: MopE-related protein [Acidobacteria bacterium]|nr:MopE-related protein [Acidobacteriota bacterium]